MDVSGLSYDAILSRFEQTTDMGTFVSRQTGISGILKILPPNDKWGASEKEVAESVDFVAGCGCTNFRTTEEGIAFTYNDDSVLAESAQEFAVKKTVTVFFIDGKRLYITDHKGNNVFNPEKMQASLTYTGIATKE